MQVVPEGNPARRRSLILLATLLGACCLGLYLRQRRLRVRLSWYARSNRLLRMRLHHRAEASKVLMVDGNTFTLQRFDHRIYPKREAVAALSVEPLEKAIGLRIELHSDLPRFSHFLCSRNGSTFRRLDGDVAEVTFDEASKGQTWQSLAVKAASLDGTESSSRVLDLVYRSPEARRQRGYDAPGTVVVRASTLPLRVTRVGDWLPSLTEDQRRFAKRRWGSWLSGATSTVDKARQIAMRLGEAFKDLRGIPRPCMADVTPFEQYERAVTGRDKVWCTNIAPIFSWICNGLAIPCRTVGLGRLAPQQPFGKKRYVFRMAGSHATTEVFSEKLNRWVWVDACLQTLGASLPDRGRLDLRTLFQAVNDPELRRRLSFEVYDPRSRSVRTIGLGAAASEPEICGYLTANQEVTYFLHPGR